jgi:replicative DNA helicase
MAVEQLRPGLGIEQLPPRNVEAEQALLGSVLLDRDVIGLAVGIVGADDFFDIRNGAIFRAMAALFERHVHIDYVTLIDELDRQGGLDEAGGIVYVSELLGAVPTPVHAEQYAQIVADAAFMRRIISAAGRIAELGFQQQYSPDEVLERCEQLIMDAARGRTLQGFEQLSVVLREYINQLSIRREADALDAGIPTGFTDLDRLLVGGLQRSDLVIVAARPGMGKTSLALAFSMNAALRQKARVAIFSLEMSKGQLAGRLLAMHSGIDNTRLRSARLSDIEQRRLGLSLGELAEAEIYIDDTPGLNVTALRAKAKRLTNDVAVDVIIVDHLQLMSGGRGGENRVQEMSEISRQLKGLARELHVPVVAISQLSRAVESRSPKIPILSDLRESGSIEQDADVVMFVYRDDYYNREDSEKPGVADLIIGKHRNGPTGQVALMFDGRTTRFVEPEVARE